MEVRTFLKKLEKKECVKIKRFLGTDESIDCLFEPEK